jgi:hypothetical protein
MIDLHMHSRYSKDVEYAPVELVERSSIHCGSDFHGKTKPSIEIGKYGRFISYEDMLRQLEKVNYKRY